MRELLAITNALAEESRVRALMALTRGELCVCQIAELLQLAPSTVSKHLSILRLGGLVESEKRGRWIYYAITAEPDDSARRSIEWVRDALARDSRIIEDTRRLKIILKEDPEELCRRQLGKSKSCSSAPATPVEARWRRAGRAGSKAR
ncbi:MAG TPA: metalloregulator ArsR/SmtB family transcription factor [Acidobacteriota bacterium]|nr:metalloregulator ArsR/SmtB family transcription factor [Acidobacteriota bacterium]